jgi:uncharacterized membrane protein YdjX (TVP38/TMEM64 family)
MKKWLVLGALLTVAVTAVAFGFFELIDTATLGRWNAWLLEFVAVYPVLAPVAFTAAYAAATIVSLPGAALFTAASGYLFGWLEGTAYTLVAQLIGTTVVFWVARRALADWILRRAGARAQRLRAGLAENAFSYLMVLRFIGLLPAFLVSAVPGAIGVPVRTYVLGTALGLIPGTLVYASIGDGLSNLAQSEEALSLENVLTPQLTAGLVGLVVLALVPVAYNRYRRRRGDAPRGVAPPAGEPVSSAPGSGPRPVGGRPAEGGA